MSPSRSGPELHQAARGGRHLVGGGARLPLHDGLPRGDRPGTCAARPMDRGHGCGGVGLSAVQIAAAADALVVAVDVDDRKLAKAREEGAVATISARGLAPEQVGQAVKDATGGGAHVSIDALGRGFTFHQSFHSLRKRGRHVQAGITSQEESGQVSLPLDLLTNLELEVVGSLGNPHPNYVELLALVVRQKLGRHGS